MLEANQTKRKIHGPHILGLTLTFMQTIVFIDFPNAAKQDVWIVSILAGLWMAPFIAMYVRIYRKNPEKNLFEIVEARFGRILSFAVSALYVGYGVMLCALSIRNFTGFVYVMMLPNTDVLYITLFFVALCVFLQKKGIVVIARYALFAIPVVAVIFVATLLISIDVMDFRKLLPIAGQPFSLLSEDAATFGLVAYGQVFLVLGLMAMPAGRPGQGKIMLWSYLCAALFVTTMLLRAVSVLGGEAFSNFFFPVYASYSVLHLGSFINRLEALTSVCIAVLLVLRAGLFLQFVGTGAAHLMKTKDEKAVSVPIIVICAALSFVLFKYNTDKSKFDKIFRWLSGFLLLVIPWAVWMVTEIQNKRTGRRR